MLQDYLNRHYITRNELLAQLGITTTELDSAIAVGMLPACSYRVQNGTVSTAVFGEHPAPGCCAGEYFAPAVAAWYRNSLCQLGSSATGRLPPAELFRRDFIEGYIKSARSNALFSAAYPSLVADSQTLEQMANDTWGHHCRGTYGVCVIEPNSFERIQCKQAAVKRLADFTGDGARSIYNAEEKNELLRLIESYNSVTMPFSPVDYHKSSRKRLVDNLLGSL